MNSEKVGRGWRNVKVSSLFVFVSVFFSFLFLAGTSAFATHDSTAELNPEWSAANQTMYYTVNYTNDGDSEDAIGEVRIYKNDNYLNFVCDEKDGWILSEPAPGICNYYAYPQETHKILPGNSEQFTFSALTPASGCEWTWQFETRDVTFPDQGSINYLSDTTSIDDVAPSLVKEIVGAQSGPCPPGAGEECWITQSTEIQITVTEEGTCGVSGLDFCEVTYTIDGGAPVQEVYEDLDGETSWYYEMTFGEDSRHVLNVTCYDIAGNKLEDIEVFRVDDTDPVTTKEFFGPKKFLDMGHGIVEWIDGVTTVELTAVDPDPTGYDCNIGVDKTLYLDTLVPFEYCWEPEMYCNEYYPAPSTECVMMAQDECEPLGKYTPEWIACVESMINHCPPTDLTSTDVGADVVPPFMWRVYDGTPIEKEEDSCHILQFYSIDELGNTEKMNTNCFFVDKTPPVLEKDNGKAILDRGEPAFMTDENPEGAFHWITSDMPITFTCTDQEPHPSEGEEVCYKVSYDYVEVEPGVYKWGYVTDQYCDEPLTADGYCCVPVDVETKEFVFYFNENEESMHNLEYYCMDAVEKQTVPHTQYYKVDDTPPQLLDKWIEGPYYAVEGVCPPNDESDICHLDGVSLINITVEDGGDICAVGTKWCHWWYYVVEEDGSETRVPDGSGYYTYDPSVGIQFPEESQHILHIKCQDLLGNNFEDVETFFVDKTPPLTEKWYVGPQYPDPITSETDNPYWITSETEVHLSATDDVGPHDSGVAVTYYRDVYLPNEVDWHFCLEECSDWEHDKRYSAYGLPTAPEPYNPTLVDDRWEEWTGEPFYKEPESCHIIEYYSIDNVDKIERPKYQCVFVDDSAPDGIKEVGEPSIPGEKESVTIHKEVTTGELAVADPEIYLLADTTGSMSSVISSVKSDMTSILGSVEAKFGAGDYKDFPYDSYAFNNRQSITDDDSLVTAAINSMSASGGSDGSEGQLYALHRIAQSDAGFSGDSTKIIVWFGDAPAHDSVCSAISGEGSDLTEASVTAELTGAGIVVIAISTTTGYYSGMDDDPTMSASDYSGYCTIGGTAGQATRIAAATGGVHLTGVDASEIKDAIIDAIGTVTETTDVVPDASECVAAGLEVSFVPVIHEDVGSSETVSFEETIGLDSINTTPETEIVCDIHFRSGVMGGIIATERVYVASTATPTSPPAGSGTVTPEIVETDLGSGDGIDWWVTTETLIELSCVDAYPHPVGHEIISWRFSNWADGFDGTPTYSEWYSESYEGEPVEVYFPEDCWHDLEFYCEDALGNIGDVDTQYYIVESVPPVITKTIEGPLYGDCPPVEEGDVCYIDNATSIHVSVYDPEPHPVNDVTCDWSYVLLDVKGISGGETGVTAPFVIKFPEESMHELTIVCRDALGNTVTDVEVFHVDHTPPVTTKTYEGPEYSEEGSDYPKWINFDTIIELSVEDAGPHKSGINETNYRVTRVEDENCWDQEVCQGTDGTGDWNAYTGIFNIPEESCHLIEYYSVDNVDKAETINRQCVFVDNTPPDPIKTVGEPKEIWDGMTNGMDSIFYPGIADICLRSEVPDDCPAGENCIECWKVTLLTPITMQCIDPEPHPVDHETLCYLVDFDGDDITEGYCGEDSSMTEEGWCCGAPAGTTIYFGEESEHNLQYYCVDALGNTGPIDDEKFKVEGTAFEIELNKKWNLISVPLVMLDDSIDDVFEDVADTVDSVWTYNPEAPEGEEWSVYTPGDAPDTLHEMTPGWGYWVYSSEDSTLLIGGSLFSPAKTPPTKNIVAGWNLIGFWGTAGAEGYYGPDLYSPPGEVADCELYSLGDDFWDNKFSSLWTYWEPDNPYQWIALGKDSYMNPGAGYWMHTNQEGEYVVPTACSMFFDGMYMGPA